MYGATCITLFILKRRVRKIQIGLTSLFIFFLCFTAPTAEAAGTKAIALHNFQRTTENMLELVKGDIVTVLSKAGEEKGWWKGQIDHRVGYFPFRYVQEISTSTSLCQRELLSGISPDGTSSPQAKLQLA